MVTMTVYVNADAFVWIVSILNKSLDCEYGYSKEVSLNKSKKYLYEVQVPIQIIGQFIKKGKTTIDLFKLQELNA